MRNLLSATIWANAPLATAPAIASAHGGEVDLTFNDTGAFKMTAIKLYAAATHRAQATSLAILEFGKGAMADLTNTIGDVLPMTTATGGEYDGKEYNKIE